MKPKELVSLSLTEGNFRCYLCDELFIYPVTLPCKHSVCKLCLDKHFDNNGFTCPFCRIRVSNWLRKLKFNNANLVDSKFWKAIKSKFPGEVEAKLTGSSTVEVLPLIPGESEIKIVILNPHTREQIVSQHGRSKDISVDESESWRGWPDNFSTACRDLALQISQQLAALSESPQGERPKLHICQPGEIRQEYEEFLQKQREEILKQEEKNLRLSEVLIKMLEEDEAREKEKQMEQLKADEELARLLAEELKAKGESLEGLEMSSSALSPNTRKSLRFKSAMRDSSKPLKVEHSSGLSSDPQVQDQPVCSTPKTLLDTPSTSKGKVIFSTHHDIRTEAKRKLFYSSQTKEKKESSIHAEPGEPVPSTFSIPEFSNFTSVIPKPTTSISAAEVQCSMSRSSSGSDSISQELHHFKPIRSSPTTPTKGGSSSWVPKLVVAQRSNCDIVDMLCADPGSDISIQDIEESIALEKQIEADRKLAAMLQEEFNSPPNKRKRTSIDVKTEYNLRNKKKRSLRKNVLVDRAQATLDTMLIK